MKYLPRPGAVVLAACRRSPAAAFGARIALAAGRHAHSGAGSMRQRALAHGYRGVRRRLLLGRAGRVPACRRRHQRGLRLCRRRRRDRALRDGRQRRDRPCGIGEGHLRSAQGQLWQMLQVYFSVAHDPTELNRQGPDMRPQYRSAIFPANGSRRRSPRPISSSSSRRRSSPTIVTTIEPGKAFYPAEDYHQDYLTLHPDQPYIVYQRPAEGRNLKRIFPELYRDDRRWCRRRGRPTSVSSGVAEACAWRTRPRRGFS